MQFRQIVGGIIIVINNGVPLVKKSLIFFSIFPSFHN